MRTLADGTGPDLILPRLRTEDAAGVIQELSQLLQRAGHVSDVLRFYHTALNRELLISSEVESGVAFPHGRVPGLARVVFAMGLTRGPIAWGTNPVQGVRIVFLIAVPDGDTGPYLNLACGLTHLAKSGSLMERLLRSTGAEEILSVLREVPVRETPHQVLASGSAPVSGANLPPVGSR